LCLNWRSNLENTDSARRCRFRKSQQKRASDLDPTYVWIPKLDVVGSSPISRSKINSLEASQKQTLHSPPLRITRTSFEREQPLQMWKLPHSRLVMKALPNSAVNTPECSGFLCDAIFRHLDALLPEIASDNSLVARPFQAVHARKRAVLIGSGSRWPPRCRIRTGRPEHLCHLQVVIVTKEKEVVAEIEILLLAMTIREANSQLEPLGGGGSRVGGGLIRRELAVNRSDVQNARRRRCRHHEVRRQAAIEC
jgi:hypothetical protein